LRSLIASAAPALHAGRLGRASGLLLLGLGAALLSGCSKPAPAKAAASAGEGECPPGQTFDGQFCQVTGAPPPEVPPAEQPAAEAKAEPSAEAAPAEPAPADPAGTAAATATPAPGAAASAPSLATPVDVSMAAQAGPLITYLAGSHLPAGARPFGAPFAAQFAEGQVFEQQLKLTLGKCYTVVAAGLPPMSEVALELYDRSATIGVVGPAPTPLVRDDATGPQAVLGSRSACIKAERADLWLLIRAQKGQGVVAGQVFEK